MQVAEVTGELDVESAGVVVRRAVRLAFADTLVQTASLVRVAYVC